MHWIKRAASEQFCKKEYLIVTMLIVQLISLDKIAKVSS